MNGETKITHKKGLASLQSLGLNTDPISDKASHFEGAWCENAKHSHTRILRCEELNTTGWLLNWIREYLLSGMMHDGDQTQAPMAEA